MNEDCIMMSSVVCKHTRCREELKLGLTIDEIMRFFDRQDVGRAPYYFIKH